MYYKIDFTLANSIHLSCCYFNKSTLITVQSDSASNQILSSNYRSHHVARLRANVHAFLLLSCANCIREGIITGGHCPFILYISSDTSAVRYRDSTYARK